MQFEADMLLFKIYIVYDNLACHLLTWNEAAQSR